MPRTRRRAKGAVMDQIGEHEIRVIAVTGGGSGIGRAICVGLAERGYQVVALGRTAGTVEETAGLHEGISAEALDARDPENCAAVFARIEERFGQPVDGLIAGAAIYPRVHFLDQSPESFSDTVLTNIVGVANVMRVVLPGMLARNAGRIVVIGSLADNNPIPSAVAYSVSKGGVHALVRGVAAEIDRDRYPNVLVNELIPGATRTAMSDHGHPPEAVVPRVMALIDCPSGGPHGTCWYNGEQVRFGESWKRALLRKIMMRK